MTTTRPAPVQRWVDLVDVPMNPIETAVIEGKARFRRDGKGRWLPIQAVMWHDLGRHHVVDLRLGLGPLTFVRGLDGYVDGTGFSRISHTLDMGREIDQASLLFMWSEALLFPSAWRDRDDVVWSALDDDIAAVTFTAPQVPVVAQMAFDPDTGMPRRLSADRFKGPGTRQVEWTVDYAGWRLTDDGMRLPSDLVATWADEPGPWFKMRIDRGNPGADVSGAMARGRALLTEAAKDPTGIGTRR
jgi:hypothetical protein